MIIEFVGSDGGEQGPNTTDITATLPVHLTGDWALAVGRVDEVGDNPTLDISTAGWSVRRTDVEEGNGRHRQTKIWYREFLSASETDPVMTVDLANQHSFSVHVFRNVDLTMPFDVTETVAVGADDPTPACPPVTTVTPNCCLFLLHAFTHADITAIGVPTTPSGLTAGEFLPNLAQSHSGQAIAYKLDVGAAATYTPDDWTHSFTGSSTDWSTYSIPLRPAGNGAILMPASFSQSMVRF